MRLNIIGLIENTSKQESLSSSSLKIYDHYLTPYEALQISQHMKQLKKLLTKYSNLEDPKRPSC